MPEDMLVELILFVAQKCGDVNKPLASARKKNH